MDLKEANSRLEKVNNDIEFYLKEKERLFGKTQPQAVDTTKEAVNGGKRTDKFLQYQISLEEKQLNEKIDKKYAEKINLENYITKELHRLNKYKEVEQLVIYYKEQCVQNYTWEEIGKKVYMHKDTCRKIYRRWKKETI